MTCFGKIYLQQMGSAPFGIISLIGLTSTINLLQGLLQLDDIGSQHDPPLRVIGGHSETFEGNGILMLQNKC